MSPSPSSNTRGINHTEIHFVYYRYVDNRFIAFNSTFLKHLATRTLIHPDFYGNPVQLEPVEDMHLLGFDVDLHQRTISYIPPDAPWKIRDYASAGSTRLRLSGLHSRAHLIRKYTYPSLAVERALYVQKGHDLRSCRQALQKACVLADLTSQQFSPMQSAPHPALCVCQHLFPRFSQLTYDTCRWTTLCLPISSSRGAVNLIPSTAQRRRWFEIVKREGTPSRVPAGQCLTRRFTNLKETLLNIYNSFDPATFRFSFLPVQSSQGELHTDTSSCEQQSKCVRAFALCFFFLCVCVFFSTNFSYRPPYV